LIRINAQGRGLQGNKPTQEGLMQLHPDRPAVGHSSGNNLLSGRMAILGLDLDAIKSRDSDTFNMLSRRCARCDQHETCAIDFRRDPNDPVWETYCPNSPRLNALTELWWLRLRV
jgi:hypothetical protein